jgi:hypothetical protein
MQVTLTDYHFGPTSLYNTDQVGAYTPSPSRLGRAAGTRRAISVSCRVMVNSSPRLTRSTSSDSLFLASARGTSMERVFEGSVLIGSEATRR